VLFLPYRSFTHSDEVHQLLLYTVYTGAPPPAVRVPVAPRRAVRDYRRWPVGRTAGTVVLVQFISILEFGEG
jgi:hypothetical protein